MKSKPIKRHEALKPISREHHHGLLLCWKIRTGFTQKIDPKRIKDYADWFFSNHLLSHFEIEEQHIFPVLGNEHPLIKKALSEHRRLTRLFSDQEDIQRSLSLIEEELESHIRFEERMLFNELQEVATEEELKHLEEMHQPIELEEEWPDSFWISK